jgi:hypothetical protein
MSQPFDPPSAHVPASYPPAPAKSNRTLWIVLGSIIGGGFLLLLCVGVLVIGTLSMLGTRVSSVFNEIEAGLASAEAASFVEPIDTSNAIAMNETGHVGDFDVVVQRSWVVQQSEATTPGYAYRAVEFTITNRSGQPVQAEDAIVYSRVQDATGATYECCVFDAEDAFMIDETLNPGATGTTVEVYEVPEESQQLFFVYESFDADSPPVVVALP